MNPWINSIFMDLEKLTNEMEKLAKEIEKEKIWMGKKFEYKIVYATFFVEDGQLTRVLNQWGQEGWMLVSRGNIENILVREIVEEQEVKKEKE